MKMPCDREELLSRFLDGDLDVKEAAEMRKHLFGCSWCKIFLHETRESEKMVREVVGNSLFAMPLREKVMQSIRLGNFQPIPIAHKKPHEFSAFCRALSAIIVVLIAVLFLEYCLRPIFTPVVMRSSNHPRQGWRDCGGYIVISALGPGAEFARLPLRMNEFKYAAKGTILEFKGPMAFSGKQYADPFLKWNGKGYFGIEEGTITWKSGSGEFTSVGTEPARINLGSANLNVSSGILRVSGSDFSSIYVTLIEGVAKFKSGEKEESLGLGVPFEIKDGCFSALNQEKNRSPVPSDDGAEKKIIRKNPKTRVPLVAPVEERIATEPRTTMSAPEVRQPFESPFSEDPIVIPDGGE